MAADETGWHTLLEFARTYYPYSSNSRVTLWFSGETPIAQVVNEIRRMAEEKRMVIEWGYYDKSRLPFDDKDEPCVLASVYHTGDSQERIVCLNVRLPGAARELCEALWGHPVFIDLDIDLSDLDET